MSDPRVSAALVVRGGAIVLAILGMLVAIPAQAQVAGATLTGTITDPAGRVVPGAQIVITNEATGVVNKLATNSDGNYTAGNLIPGDYTISITAAGFNTEERTGIELTVGGQQVLDLTLKVGASKISVEVTTEAPEIQLNSSDISAVVNATTVRELPLNGRSWTDLATLQPGVNRIQTQPDFSAGTDRGNRGFGQQLTISGARPQQNNYRLDGVSLNDYSNGAPGSVLGGSLGVDAIQEFSVLTSNYSAEYGKTSGGVVNAITRSGTNQFHGSGYEFARNSALDTRNFFDPVGTKPPFKRNQFGGTFGGPIFKDKTFFFADYEAIRQSKGISVLATVLSLADRASVTDSAVKSYLTFFPVPNVTGTTDKYRFTQQQVVSENFFTTRIDHNFSDKDRMFGTYFFDKTPYQSPDGLKNVQFDTSTARQIVAIEETHVFAPNFANSARFGLNHEKVSNNQSLKALNPDAARTDLGVQGSAFAGRTAAQVIIGGGPTPFTGGVGGSPTYYYHWNSVQAYDDALLTRGKHSFKFGGAFEREFLYVLSDTDPNGIFRFATVNDFLTNNPSRFQGGVATSTTPRNIRQSIFGLYLQDDWRVRTNLTLNLGVRYEMASVPTETNGKFANLPSLTSSTPLLGNHLFNNPTLKNFEPRVGFAWDPFHNGKTAIRGGAGIFDVLPLPYQFILLTNQADPFFKYVAISPGSGTFFNKVPIPDPILKDSLRSTFIDSHPKRNYVTQWNLNIQQQLAPNLTAMVAYVDEINRVQPTKTPYGYLYPQVDINGNLTSGPNAGQQPSRLNPYGSVRALTYQGHSSYNALEAQLAKRMSHGFQMQGTFTWSKSIDTNSASVAGDTFGNSISSLDAFDLKLNRGLSDFNVGRTLVINGEWEVPTPKSLSGPAKWALGGWQLGLIFTASDGIPFTATYGTGGDPQYNLSSDDWAYPNRLGGAGCKTLTNPGSRDNYIKTQCFAVPSAPNMAFWLANCDQFPPNAQSSDPTQPPFAATFPDCYNLRGNAGRNILIGPGLTSLDFSLFKNMPIKRISERFNVQFRAEIFNILNHANFAPPTTPDNTDIFDNTGALAAPGLLSRTTTTAREIQLAVKVTF
jgi:outer membrane receptor protein involved in Fe transport